MSEHPSAKFLRITAQGAYDLAFKPQRSLSYLFGDSKGVRTTFSILTAPWLIPIALTGGMMEAVAEKIDGIPYEKKDESKE